MITLANNCEFMSQPSFSLSSESCRKARLSRDPRFDGKFFIGVITTGIFCRPICPAVAPKEENVRYFDSAVSAASAGLRPCLRCRPDSAPQSSAWKGTKTSIERALNLIEAGVLSGDDGISIECLAEKLGISSRYLRKLFTENFGTSPKKYSQFRDLMFAKQLLHQTELSVTQVAFASGFNSVRRFNESFKQTLKLTPSNLRKQTQSTVKTTDRNDVQGISLSLFLAYRPPFDWQKQMAFYKVRMVESMEWFVDDLTYCRSFQLNQSKGYFEAKHCDDKNGFFVNVHLAESDDLASLKDIISQIRRLLDLDADMAQIEAVTTAVPFMENTIISGLRLPGTWSGFEAGCRAVLGQQVSIIQASKLLNKLVMACGEKINISGRNIVLFPTPRAVSLASLDELKMPGARKTALNALGQYVHEHPDGSLDDWLLIKGIGPWTVAYAKMRGLSDPNVLLCSDLVVKKRVLKLCEPLQMTGVSDSRTDDQKSTTPVHINYQALTEQLTKQVSPWGSYLTFQLWNLT